MLADDPFHELADDRYKEWNDSGALGNLSRRPRLVALDWATFRVRVDTQALAAAAQTFVITRCLLGIATYLAMALHPSIWGAKHPSSPTFWDAWYQWDARWYVRVARGGYQFQDIHHWSTVAFFPFYPALILAGVTVVPVSTKLVALLVSNVLFFWALFVLHRLVRREFDGELAARTVWYISIFPTALFFFAGYSEAPFLLLTVMSVAAMRERHWAAAGLWGLLASATRSQGLVLLIPFAVELWQAEGSRWWRKHASLSLGLVPLGMAGFALIMNFRFANPLLFVEIQRAWHRTTTWPWTGILASLQSLAHGHVASPWPSQNLTQIACVLLFLWLIVSGWRLLPLSFSLYAAAGLLLILVNPAILDGYREPLMSTSRLCLALFPCFITLAKRGEDPGVDRWISTIGPGMLAIFAVVFLQGGWVA
ncbi:MAG TPA: mannosyltransferase family protein [Chloroflexota bacterium]|jgi:Gpi18-like mannosyltransferase